MLYLKDKLIVIFVLGLCLLASPTIHADEALEIASVNNSNDAPLASEVKSFSHAKTLWQEGDYVSSVRAYRLFIKEFPESERVMEARFKVADGYMRVGLLRRSIVLFERFLEDYKDDNFSLLAERKLKKAVKKLRLKQDSKKAEDLAVVRLKSPSERLRAVQILIFEGSTLAEVREEIKALKRSGVNTIILRVFHNKGDRHYKFAKNRRSKGVYFNTTHAPVVDDVLGKILPIAHSEGVDVFAWMTTRYANYGIESRRDLACKSYDMKTQGVVRCKGLDLFNDTAVRHLEGLYRDLAKYDIDGILFQDDLILKQFEGFGDFAERGFRRATGEELRAEKLYLPKAGSKYVGYTELFWRWAKWKNERLLHVASRLQRVVKEENPGVKFALNLMYESVTNPRYSLAWLSQDLERAVSLGFDYYSIMAYHRQIGEELYLGGREVEKIIDQMVIEATRVVKDPEKVLIKLQTIDWNTGRDLSNKEVVGYLRSVRKSGVSLALMPYRSNFPFKELKEPRVPSNQYSSSE